MSTSPRFFSRKGPFRLADIARDVGGEVRGNGDILLEDVASLNVAQPGEISFFNNLRYQEDLQKTRAGACLVSKEHKGVVPKSTLAVVVKDPYSAFAKVGQLFYPGHAPAPAGEEWEISPLATVHPTAKIEKGVTIGPYTVVEEGVEIGAGTVIGAHGVLARGVTLGRSCVLESQVTVQCAHLGNRVVLQAGVRIGCDGFGFAFEHGKAVKIPQLGRVIIQDDVEIGANSTVDRGSNSDTLIGEGTKTDNHVLIGHNATVGRHCLLVGFSGLSGSCKLGDYVVLGAQSGVVGHVKVASHVVLAGRGAITKNIDNSGGVYAGMPARPIKQWKRAQVILGKLARESWKSS